MFQKISLLALSYAAIASAQQIGTFTAERHPSLTWQRCTKTGGCTTVNGQVVLDSNWRWLHKTGSPTNCYTGNTWDTTACPDNVACAANCALDGADYLATYGVSTSGNALTLKFVTQSAQKNVGSRLYLMSDSTHYQSFKPLNQEFTFDVDVSQLPCGLNGALYFSEMPLDGGISTTNKAGAQYGTGYCDSQCPRDLKFIAGKANVEGWTPDSNSANTGKGNNGACCGEMDIWEANSISAAYTPHPCTQPGLSVCTGLACGGPTNRYGSVCDPDGCDFNSYRQGNTSFYGPGKIVNTSQKFTVVTQFITDTGTSTGTLSEIRRFYVQNGKVIPNSVSRITGTVATNAITSQFCDQQKTAFSDERSFQNKGGMAGMSSSLARGHVLVLSIWDDYAANMLWLDSNYPLNRDPSQPGVARGTCPTTSGVPADVEAQYPNSQVIYSNIKFGDIGSTFGSGTGTSNPVTTTTTSSAPGATQTQWGQCGGIGWTGPTVCQSPYTCQVQNPYYSQCL